MKVSITQLPEGSDEQITHPAQKTGTPPRCDLALCTPFLLVTMLCSFLIESNNNLALLQVILPEPFMYTKHSELIVSDGRLCFYLSLLKALEIIACRLESVLDGAEVLGNST